MFSIRATSHQSVLSCSPNSQSSSAPPPAKPGQSPATNQDNHVTLLKVSRQEYLKKMEQKKLEELRFCELHLSCISFR
ncbi:hypothetical protein AAHA92_21845 [Salvia divinorum]|uniref:Uncharacterized protein n=1 Tax=Salvia divinorum TaxID=28513 RepID=A0ABD1GLR7_SALDI